MKPQTEKWAAGVAQPHAYLATRAIMRLLARQGLPGSYVGDVAIDVNWLYEHPEVTRFVFCWRDHGTNIIVAADRLEAERAVFGDECVFCVYDEDTLPGVALYREEPELQPVSYPVALAFLQAGGNQG